MTPVDFLFPMSEGDRAKRLRYAAVLTAHDALGGRRQRYRLSRPDFAFLAPDIHPDHLIGGRRYREASTDDARLVLRVLREAVRRGGSALNYATVTSLLRCRADVVGVRVQNSTTGKEAEVHARAVINATGAWADLLRVQVGGAARMRPLRGSHMVFSSRRFPMSIGLNVTHPRDGRQITVTPWQGATLVGTTDVEHRTPLGDDVTISHGYRRAERGSVIPDSSCHLEGKSRWPASKRRAWTCPMNPGPRRRPTWPSSTWVTPP